jgi:hypothetical protein
MNPILRNWLIIILLILGIIGLLIIDTVSRYPVRQYTGTIIQIDKWNSCAFMQTKTKTGKDTIISVRNPRHSHFVIGQVLTVWTGGGARGNKATTEPQK